MRGEDPLTPQRRRVKKWLVVVTALLIGGLLELAWLAAVGWLVWTVVSLLESIAHGLVQHVF
jgi:hypothetical protein